MTSATHHDPKPAIAKNFAPALIQPCLQRSSRWIGPRSARNRQSPLKIEGQEVLIQRKVICFPCWRILHNICGDLAATCYEISARVLQGIGKTKENGLSTCNVRLNFRRCMQRPDRYHAAYKACGKLHGLSYKERINTRPPCFQLHEKKI